jgi:hypothetical protein
MPQDLQSNPWLEFWQVNEKGGRRLGGEIYSRCQWRPAGWRAPWLDGLRNLDVRTWSTLTRPLPLLDSLTLVGDCRGDRRWGRVRWQKVFEFWVLSTRSARDSAPEEEPRELKAQTHLPTTTYHYYSWTTNNTIPSTKPNMEYSLMLCTVVFCIYTTHTTLTWYLFLRVSPFYSPLSVSVLLVETPSGVY